MHLTVKREATKPTAANTLQQQDRFDGFVERYNRERPHEGRAMKDPADVYAPSSRPYAGLPLLEYPFYDWSATVTHCGRVCHRGQKVKRQPSLRRAARRGAAGRRAHLARHLHAL
jgi:putative transposase